MAVPTAHPVAAEYPHRTFNGTPTCSNHIGTVLYETHVASQKESVCVHIGRIFESGITFISPPSFQE